jgi:L-lactate dehydrogenase complex protein LldF
VKIPLHHQLLVWRGEIVRRGLLPWPKRIAMKLGSLVFRHTWLYNLSGRFARLFIPILPRWLLYNRLNDWGRQRELPPFPKKSFRELYLEQHGQH